MLNLCVSCRLIDVGKGFGLDSGLVGFQKSLDDERNHRDGVL